MPPPTSNPLPRDPGLDAVLAEIELQVESNWPRPRQFYGARQVLKPGGFDRSRPGRRIAHGFRPGKLLPSHSFPVASDIVCHDSPLYKARAGRRFSAALHHEDGLTLEKLRELSTLRKRAFHERPPARLFSRQAAGVEGRDPARDRGSRCRRCRKRTSIILISPTAHRPETDRAIELRARDRQRKLISKIDAALQRIDDNTYGYCEETGEPICAEAAGGPPDRDAVGGGAGAPREAREGLSRRVGFMSCHARRMHPLPLEVWFAAAPQ